MIQYLQVLDAVNRLAGLRENIPMSKLEQHLALSLDVYKRRGEFNGTMKDAIECLVNAEYELSDDCWKIISSAQY